MSFSSRITFGLLIASTFLTFAQSLSFAQEPAEIVIKAEETTSDAPVPPTPFPELTHFERLWKTSMFTSRVVAVEKPEGPNFTHLLALAGVYEVDGKPSVVIVDKATQVFTEARLDKNNEAGIRVLQIEQGASPDKARVELQNEKMEKGWITFSAEAAAPAGPSGGPGGGPNLRQRETPPPMQPPPPVVTPAQAPTDDSPPLPPN